MMENQREEDRDAPLTAKDLRAVGGVSYRQINDWDSKGTLPNQRASARGWRRYTAREAFAILVSAQLRSRLGLSAEKVRPVSQWLQEGPGHPLVYAVHQIRTLGTACWLVTDCEETFWIRPDIGITADWEEGWFYGEHDSAWVYLRLNGIVKRMLDHCGSKIDLSLHGLGYELDARVRQQGTTTSAERAVIAALREPSAVEVRVELKDGEIRSWHSLSRDFAKTEDEVVRLIREGTYQQIRVIQIDGRIIGVERSKVHKPGDRPEP